MKVLFYLTILALALFAYTADAQGATGPCPVICPAIYSPVCVTDRNGAKTTYPNSCSFRSANCREPARGLTITSNGACP